MKRGLFAVVFLSMMVLVLPAFADSVSVHEDNGQGSLAWQDAGRALTLKSGDRRGVRVVEARPEGVLGLRTSDVILAVDGQPVTSIDTLLKRLHASRSTTARMLVRRDGKPQVVTVAVNDYKRFMPPDPPPPPAPPPPAPPPPAPPPPPPPPPPPVSGG